MHEHEHEVVFDAKLQCYVCVKCGLVLEERPLVSLPPYTNTESKFDPGWKKINPRYYDYAIGTIIPGKPKWVNMEKSHTYWRFVRIFKKINEYAHLLGVPEYIILEALGILRKKPELIEKHASAERIALGTLYIALASHGLTKRLYEFFTRQQVRIGAKLMMEAGVYPRPKPTLRDEAVRHITEIVSKLDLPEHVKNLVRSKAIEIVRTTPLRASPHPRGLASAAVYIALKTSGYMVPKSKIYKIVNCSDRSMNNGLKALGFK